MPRSFADFESQYHSTNRAKHISFLPTSQNRPQSSQRHHHDSKPSTSSNLNPYANQNPSHRRKDSSGTTSASTSAATSRSSTANSMNLASSQGSNGGQLRDVLAKASEISPTADIAEWAHQTHLRQRRSYWWCQGCFPKEVSEPLHIPKAVENKLGGRRVRFGEGETGYD